MTVYSDYYCEYKLDASPDSIWVDGYGMENYIEYDISSVGNLDIEAPQIIFKQGFAFFNRTLSKGFGLSYSEQGDLGRHIRRYLVYAIIKGVEYGNPVSVRDEKSEIPSSYNLSQNYPNPFNPISKIRYQIPIDGKVEIKLYDALGREIRTLANEEKPRGGYEIILNGSNLTSGVYIYTLKSGQYLSSKKLILMK